MKKTLVLFKILLLSVLAQALCSCLTFPSASLSPLTEPHTARTLGKGNNEVDLSLGVFGSIKGKELFNNFRSVELKSIEYTRGLSDHFDLAVFAEMQNLNILLGLSGMHQWMHHEQHTLSFLFSAGLNKGYNKFSMNPHTEEYDPEEYKKAAEDPLLGFFIYAGPVYSFKPNEKYEWAFNIRINHSYSQIIRKALFGPNFLSGNWGKIRIFEDSWLEWPVKFLNWLTSGDEPAPTPSLPKKERIDKFSGHLLYGSANMSNTWWFTPSFGATFSLGFLYPFYDITYSKYGLDFLIIKPSFNFHTQF